MCNKGTSPMLLPLFREQQITHLARDVSGGGGDITRLPIVLAIYAVSAKGATGNMLQPFVVTGVTTTMSLVDRTLTALEAAHNNNAASSAAAVPQQRRTVLPHFCQLAPELADGDDHVQRMQQHSGKRVAHSEMFVLATNADLSSVFFHDDVLRRRMKRLARLLPPADDATNQRQLLPLATQSLLDKHDRTVVHRTPFGFLSAIADDVAQQSLLMQVLRCIKDLGIGSTVSAMGANARGKWWPYYLREMLHAFRRTIKLDMSLRPLSNAYLAFTQTVPPLLFVIGNSILNARAFEAFVAVFALDVRSQLGRNVSFELADDEFMLQIAALVGQPLALRKLLAASARGPQAPTTNADVVNPYSLLRLCCQPAASLPVTLPAMPFPAQATAILHAVGRWLGLLPSATAVALCVDFAVARRTTARVQPTQPQAQRGATASVYTDIVCERGGFQQQSVAQNVQECEWLRFCTSDAVSTFVDMYYCPNGTPLLLPGNQLPTESVLVSSRASRAERIRASMPVVAGFVLYKQFMFLNRCFEAQRQRRLQKHLDSSSSSSSSSNSGGENSPMFTEQDEMTALLNVLAFSRPRNDTADFAAYSPWLEGTRLL
jgi:hypothetical protein